MIICSCFGTTDRDIRNAYGPDGDRRCPAGQGCGGCLPLVQAIASQADQREPKDARQDGRRGRAPRP